MDKGLSVSRQIPLICRGHSRPVPFLSYSPVTEDGFFIISACLDGKPMLRNGQTGDWIGTFIGHKGAVWGVSLNSIATRAASGSADYTAKIWDSISGDALHSFEHKRIVKSVAFSPDDKKLLTGGQEKLLRIFSLEKPESEPFCLEDTSSSPNIKSALWISDNIIISVAAENFLRVWDVRTGQVVNSVATRANVSSMELSRSGNVLTTTQRKTVTFFNPERFDELKSYHLNVEVNSASLSPDQNRFVAGGQDFYAHVHDYHTGAEIEVHKGHHGPVHCIRYAPDGETYASGSEDGTIRLWQTTVKAYGLWQQVGVQEGTTGDVSSKDSTEESSKDFLDAKD